MSNMLSYLQHFSLGRILGRDIFSSCLLIKLETILAYLCMCILFYLCCGWSITDLDFLHDDDDEPITGLVSLLAFAGHNFCEEKT